MELKPNVIDSTPAPDHDTQPKKKRARLRDKLTDSDVNLSRADFSGNRVYGLEARAALPIDGANGDGLGDTGSEGGHTSSEGASTGRENISNSNVLNESGVDTGPLPNGTQDTGEVLLRPCIFETSFPALGDRRTNSSDDDDVIVVLAQNVRFSSLGEEIRGDV